MPYPQLITSGIERAFNTLLQLDSDSQKRLQKLAGRSLQVSVQEFPWPLLFSFSDQVDIRTVLVDENESSTNQAADCVIELDLQTLPKLKDTSQLTQLIQQKKLNLVGDIYVAQTFSSLIKELDIDWEEQLSKYTGDIVAHQTFSSAKALLTKVKNELDKGAKQAHTKLTQTDSIAVSQNEIYLFSDKVNDLRSDVERLNAKISLLEQQKQADTDSNREPPN